MNARWIAIVLLALGCGGDDAPGDGGGVDGGVARDAPSEVDAPEGVDAPPASDAGRPTQIQCRTSDDCMPLTGSGCFQARPGGVCSDCSEDGDRCPDGAECIMGGTSGSSECAYPCEDDGDCAVGTRCTDVGGGRYCQPIPCGDGMPPCPEPYSFCRPTTATLSECARPMCSAGPCPAPLECPAGGAFCLEP